MQDQRLEARRDAAKNRKTVRPRAIAIAWHQRREKWLEGLSALFLLTLFAIFLMSLTGCGMDSNATGSSAANGGGTSQNTISGMQIGQAQVLNFANGFAQIDFTENNPSQHYILAVSGGLSGSQLSAQKGNLQTARLQNFFRGSKKHQQEFKPTSENHVFANPADDEGLTNVEAHAWFREQEKTLALEEHQNTSLTSFGTGGGTSGITGSSSTFKVLRSTQGAFVNITADSIGTASNIEVFWDNNNQAVSTTEKTQLVTKLNEMADTLISMLGAVNSDIDSNGKVKVVLTKELTSFSGGALTGYFSASDLSPARPESNGGEVIFLLAPDTSSYYGGSIPPSTYLARVVPGVFIHEFQHLFNFLYKGGQEDPSKNEAISHALENYGQYPHELRYKQKECLENIASVKLENVTDIKTRGCAGLLIQHICEQSDNERECYAKIIKSPNRGWQALSFDTGKDLGEHLAKFMAALVVSGSNLTTGATATTASSFGFKPLSNGPAGDKVGFVPYLNNYGDWRRTKVNGVAFDKSGLQTKNLEGFSDFVEITAADDLSLRFSSNGLNALANGGAGVLIRVSDQGASNLSGNQ